MWSRGDTVQVCVTHCEASNSSRPCRVWAQVDFAGYDTLVELMSEFESSARLFQTPSSIADICCGQVVCAKYAVDNSWYRVQIKAVNDNDPLGIECFFVDYGNTEVVLLSDIVLPPPKYTQLPFLANAFIASHLAPKNGQRWSDEELRQMTEQLNNNEYTVKIVQEGGCDSPPAAMFFLGDNALESILESQGIGKYVKEGIPLSGTPSQAVESTGFSMDVGSDHDVCISFVNNDGSFFCQLLKNANDLDNVMCEIQRSQKIPLQNPSVGSMCLAICTSDNLPYRACIKTLNANSALVSYVDFGGEEELGSDSLFEIDPSLLRLPSQALLCRLNLADEYVLPKLIGLLAKYESKIPVAAKVVGLSKFHVVEVTDHSGFEPVQFRTMLLAGTPRKRTTSTGQFEEALTKGKTLVPPAETGMDADEEIFVTTILSPSKFFGQLTKYPSDELDVFQEKLQEYYAPGTAPSLSSVSPGDFCCAQFADDGLYYRARVLSECRGRWTVCYVDYGNEELKSADDLLVLDQHFCNLPCQGISCVLNEEFTVDDLESTFIEKELIVHILQKQQFDYKVSLPPCEKNAEFQQAMPNLFTTQASPKPKSAPVRQMNNVALRKLALDASSWHEVMVSHINDPCSICCQPADSAEALTSLMDAIVQYVETLPFTEMPSVPQLGSAVLAQFSADEGWYRARVTGVLSSGRYEVLFVDYGNHDTVTASAMRPITAELSELPCQAICCQMKGLAADAIWSPEEIDDLWEFVADKKLQVLLSEWDAREEKFCSEFFFKQGNINIIYGKKIGKLCRDFESCSPPPDPFRSGMRISTLQKPRAVAAAGPVMAYQQLNLQKNKYADWQVTYSVHPGLFWCQLFDSKLDELMEEILAEYNALQPTELCLPNPLPGQVCCAIYSEDSCWYRAIIKGVHQKTALVQFVDYGNEEERPTETLKILNQRFLRLPQQAFQANLVGVKPKGGQWSEAAIEKFEELVLDKKLVGAIVASHEDGSHDVELCSQDKLICEELIRCGFAEEEAEGGLDEPQPERRLSVSSTASSRSSVSTTRPDGLKAISLKPEQFVDVGIAHSVDPCRFWVQLSEQTSRLQHLMNRLESVYTALGPSDMTLPEVDVHLVVCAKFSEDENWYRAQVLAVQGNKVHLQYVDYGNDEWLTLDQIKQLKRAFLELPAQAVLCRLHGVEPREWTDNQLIKFEELTCDKNLVAIVQSGDPDAGYSVQLIDADQVNVAEQLMKPTLKPTSEAASRQSAPTPEPPVERASSIEPRRQRSQEPPLAWQPFSIADLESGSVHNVMVSWVNSPACFFIQLAEAASQLEQLSEELYDCYQAMKLNELTLHDSQIGQSCVAYYQADGNWYRGRLLSKDGMEAKVAYVDYGNMESVPMSKVKQIKPEFNALPAFAIECSLPGAEQVKWDKQKIKQFESLSSELVKCKIIHRDSNGYVVDLLSAKGQTISKEMGLASFKRPSQSPAVSPARPSSEAAASIPEHLNLQVGSSSQIEISNVTDLHHFNCQLVKQSSDVLSFQEKFEAHYSSGNAPNVGALKEGMIVAAKFTDDFWYRAKILSVESPSAATVKFLDYGNIDTVQKPLIKVLHPDFQKDPIYSFECSLSGLPSQCPAEMLDSFNDMLVDQQVSLTVNKKIGEKYEVSVRAPDGSDIKDALLNKHPVVSQRESNGPAAVPQATVSQTVAPRSQEVFLSSNPGLKVGSSFPVEISNVTHVNSFDCQLVKDLSTIEAFQLKFEAHYSSGNAPDVGALKEGMIVAAKFTDDFWYRAKILTVESPETATAKFLDYGNIDTIQKPLIKVLHEDFQKDPIYSFECSLSGLPSQCPDEMLDSFNEMVVSHQVTLTVNEKSQDIFSVSLQTIGGKDVKSSLLSAHPVKETDQGGQIESSEAAQVAQQPQAAAIDGEVSLSCNPVLKVGSSFPAEISNVVHINSFDCQLVKDLSTIEAFQLKFEAHYSSGNAPDVGALKEGMIVAAKFTDDFWYRAKILTVESPETATAKFLDYGNIDTIQKPLIKVLHEDFQKDPMYSFQCSLSGLPSQCPDDMITSFNDMVIGHQVTLTVDGTIGSTFGVSLKLSNGSDVASALLEAHPEAAIAVSEETPVLATQEEGKGEGIYITGVVSPTKFYIQRDADSDRVATMEEQLFDQYDPLPHVEGFKVEQGTLCCARSSADGGWYRGEVQSLQQAGKFSLLFVDYGITEMVAHSDLKCLSKEHQNQPFLATVCSLHGCCEPAEGWSADQVAAFEELAQGGDKCFIAEFHTDSVISLFDGAENVGAAFENAATVVFDPVKCPAGSVQVYVSHVESLDELYVQLVDNTETLDQLMEELEAQSAGLSSCSQLRVGTACAMQFSEDNAWYRARIQSLNGGSAKVQYIDYGNSEEVVSSGIKSLPSNMLIPPIALQCQLQGSSEVRDLSDQFLELVEEQELTAKFSGNQQPFTVALVSAEGGDILQCLKSSASSEAPAEPEEIQDEDSLPVEDTHEITESEPLVSCYADPEVIQGKQQVMVVHLTEEEVYVQLSKKSVDLEQILDHVDEHCQSADPLARVCAGLSCCAQHKGVWQRAEVRFCEGDAVTVQLIDIGMNVILAISDLRQIDADLVKVPRLALKCCLPQCDVDQLKEISQERLLTAELTGDVEPFSISFADLQTAEAMTVEEERAAVEEESALVNYHEAHDAENNADEVGHSEWITGEKRRVILSHIVSPSLFWCQRSGQDEKLAAMQDQLMEWCANQSPCEDVSLGDLCAAKFSEDDCWYRARVMLHQDDRIIVHFVDYGNFDHATVSELRPLSSTQAIAPWAALQCSLQGVAPHEGDTWSTDACSRFEELSIEKTLLAEASAIDDDGVQTVKLMDMGCCLAERLQQEGLALEAANTPPAPSLEAEALKFSRWEESYDAETSVCEGDVAPAASGEIIQQLNFEENEQAEVDAIPANDEACLGVGAGDSHCKDNSLKKSVSAVEEIEPYVGSLSPMSLQAGVSVGVHASNVISPVDFWCQSADSESLSALMDAMNEEGVYQDAPGTEPLEGLAFVAKYSQDQLWYRVTVQSVADEEIEVLFVDYGNVEIVESVQALRAEHAALPCQAFHCALHGVQAISEEWDEASLGRFEELMEEDKKFTLTVVEVAADRVWAQLREGDESVAELMVSGGYATKNEGPSSVEELVQSIIEGARNQLAEEDQAKEELSASAEDLPEDFAEDFTDEPADEQSFLEVSQCMDNSVGDLAESAITTSDDRPFPFLTFSEGDSIPIKILSALDPDNLLCQPLEFQQRLTELLEELTTEMTTSGVALTELQNGQPCAALFSGDRWLRATILSSCEEAVSVYSIDVGLTESVSSVYLLPQKFLALPEQALRCSLHGIKPAETAWSEDSGSTILDLCQADNVTASVISQDSGDLRLMVKISSNDKDVSESLVESELAVNAEVVASAADL
ncbi:hypothetical protein CAPTEDRAFT_226977 [Capitella teleta]|uniref:Tudor domain-containing protein n=1 Tax=Capitella teleta TaxID=283909 RepID=R7VFW0_CAPTE|nr:hypothetical protein CAPTEDRAFT_226977 [Capitella teleta]|eukprot:ELU14575.1 hypothetical protein CAPTEDRAFT_226977 [Capitella teleta]